jgi:hypothetical protein
MEYEGQMCMLVSNRFYACIISIETGQILSLKDKRTKNFQREIVQKGKALNTLVIHDDVPFFWDNWDIMHHSYETKHMDVQTDQHYQ